jgi:ATP adenylyltransferase
MQLHAYAHLKHFLAQKMRMAHVYQEADGYRLVPDIKQLTTAEVQELVGLCDEAVASYAGRRGRKLYDHRRIALGDLSGTVRYEVLKRAGFRCDFCGISAEERTIEVDHIQPRRRGGSDDISNLQALCYKCNANKGRATTQISARFAKA